MSTPSPSPAESSPPAPQQLTGVPRQLPIPEQVGVPRQLPIPESSSGEQQVGVPRQLPIPGLRASSRIDEILQQQERLTVPRLRLALAEAARHIDEAPDDAEKRNRISADLYSIETRVRQFTRPAYLMSHPYKPIKARMRKFLADHPVLDPGSLDAALSVFSTNLINAFASQSSSAADQGRRDIGGMEPSGPAVGMEAAPRPMEGMAPATAMMGDDQTAAAFKRQRQRSPIPAPAPPPPPAPAAVVAPAPAPGPPPPPAAVVAPAPGPLPPQPQPRLDVVLAERDRAVARVAELEAALKSAEERERALQNQLTGVRRDLATVRASLLGGVGGDPNRPPPPPAPPGDEEAKRREAEVASLRIELQHIKAQLKEAHDNEDRLRQDIQDSSASSSRAREGVAGGGGWLGSELARAPAPILRGPGPRQSPEVVLTRHIEMQKKRLDELAQKLQKEQQDKRDAETRVKELSRFIVKARSKKGADNDDTVPDPPPPADEPGFRYVFESTRVLNKIYAAPEEEARVLQIIRGGIAEEKRLVEDETAATRIVDVYIRLPAAAQLRNAVRIGRAGQMVAEIRLLPSLDASRDLVLGTPEFWWYHPFHGGIQNRYGLSFSLSPGDGATTPFLPDIVSQRLLASHRKLLIAARAVGWSASRDQDLAGGIYSFLVEVRNAANALSSNPQQQRDETSMFAPDLTRLEDLLSDQCAMVASMLPVPGAPADEDKHDAPEDEEEEREMKGAALTDVQAMIKRQSVLHLFELMYVWTSLALRVLMPYVEVAGALLDIQLMHEVGGGGGGDDRSTSRERRTLGYLRWTRELNAFVGLHRILDTLVNSRKDVSRLERHILEGYLRGDPRRFMRRMRPTVEELNTPAGTRRRTESAAFGAVHRSVWILTHRVMAKRDGPPSGLRIGMGPDDPQVTSHPPHHLLARSARVWCRAWLDVLRGRHTRGDAIEVPPRPPPPPSAAADQLPFEKLANDPAFALRDWDEEMATALERLGTQATAAPGPEEAGNA